MMTRQLLPSEPAGGSQDPLERVLQEQIAITRRRMERGGHVYPDEYREAVTAADQVRRLRRTLELGPFLRTLTPTAGKPRFLLEFGTAANSVVLKVYGRQRRGETRLLRLWNETGIRAVEVLDSADEPVTWLTMRPVPRAPLTSEEGANGVDGALVSVTRELARICRRAHALPPPDPDDDVLLSVLGYRRFGPSVRHHLVAVLATLARHGYPVRQDWSALADELWTLGRTVLLHGDLAAGNVLRDARDHQLRLLDPAAYLGPPEFDAARWAARSGGAPGGPVLLAGWLEEERTLDSDYAFRLFGLELLMEAGVRELIKDEQAEPLNYPDPRTLALVASADEFLSH